MSKHTRGKWAVAHRSRKTRHLGVYDERGKLVAAIDVAGEVEQERRDADACLIAAAPELLEALKEIVGDEVVRVRRELHEKARAAIAKATGELTKAEQLGETLLRG